MNTSLSAPLRERAHFYECLSNLFFNQEITMGLAIFCREILWVTSLGTNLHGTQCKLSGLPQWIMHVCKEISLCASLYVPTSRFSLRFSVFINLSPFYPSVHSSVCPSIYPNFLSVFILHFYRFSSRLRIFEGWLIILFPLLKQTALCLESSQWELKSDCESFIQPMFTGHPPYAGSVLGAEDVESWSSHTNKGDDIDQITMGINAKLQP